MPTPRPISVASCGEKVAMSSTCASRPVAISAQPSDSAAVSERQDHREQRAEGEEEHDRGGEEADASRRRRRPPGPAWPAGCPSRRARPAGASVGVLLGGVDDVVVGVDRDVGDRLLAVHRHRRRRRPCRPARSGARRRRRRARRRARPRSVLSICACSALIESAPKTTWFWSLDCDWKWSPRRSRASVDSVPGKREVVRVAGAGADIGGDQDDEGEEPGGDDAFAMREAPTGKTSHWTRQLMKHRILQ